MHSVGHAFTSHLFINDSNLPLVVLPFRDRRGAPPVIRTGHPLAGHGFFLQHLVEVVVPETHRAHESSLRLGHFSSASPSFMTVDVASSGAMAPSAGLAVLGSASSSSLSLAYQVWQPLNLCHLGGHLRVSYIAAHVDDGALLRPPVATSTAI